MKSPQKTVITIMVGIVLAMMMIVSRGAHAQTSQDQYDFVRTIEADCPETHKYGLEVGGVGSYAGVYCQNVGGSGVYALRDGTGVRVRVEVNCPHVGKSLSTINGRFTDATFQAVAGTCRWTDGNNTTPRWVAVSYPKTAGGGSDPTVLLYLAAIAWLLSLFSGMAIGLKVFSGTASQGGDA